MYLTIKSVVQQKCNLEMKRSKIIEAETNKLKDANFINKVHHLEWLANVVFMHKRMGSGKSLCGLHGFEQGVPQRSLSYTSNRLTRWLPWGHELLSFMDAYYGYNQVKMYKPNIEKTSFVVERGTYCYHVMPFSLKNARAIYQWLVNWIFKVKSEKQWNYMLTTWGSRERRRRITLLTCKNLPIYSVSTI